MDVSCPDQLFPDNHSEVYINDKCLADSLGLLLLTLTFKLTNVSNYALLYGSWLVTSAFPHPACSVAGWHLL